MRDELEQIWEVLEKHENRLKKIVSVRNFQKFFKRKLQYERQKELSRGVHLALCVDTRDPLKQNRVRFFSPVFNLGPITDDTTGAMTRVNQLDWASPISAMGGIDDSGLSWVPPPGSTLCLLFQNANPRAPFYVGTTWQRNKGPENNPNWGYSIPEYDKIFKGHRKGYMLGKNDESQHKPPFDTDNYQGYDVDSSVDSDLVPDAQTKTTWPHRYGLKTPEKHMISMDDGDPKCNRRFKRLEIMSSMGHYFLMKDDPYNHCGAWVNPKCKTSFVSITPEVCVASYVSVASLTDPVPQPYPCQQGPENCNNTEMNYVSSITILNGGSGYTSSPTVSFNGSGSGAAGTATVTDGVVISVTVTNGGSGYTSPPTVSFSGGGGSGATALANLSYSPIDQDYQGSEYMSPTYDPFSTVSVEDGVPSSCMGVMNGDDFCFAFNNDGKNKYHKHKQECFPFLNNRCGLPQSGMMLLSRAGGGLTIDDSVEEPRGRNEWERTLKEFDMDGATGVFKGRTYIRSATGQYIELNDQEVNPRIRGPRNGINIVSATGNAIHLNDHTLENCVAGTHRGVHIKSSADHTLDMCDDGNQQCSTVREGCSKTGPYAKKAFIRLRSGYGLTLIMNDAQDQTKTDKQYLQLMAPQKDNTQRGPHILHMQEKPTGAGQIFLRAGGDYVINTYDQMVEIVGDENENPSDKLEYVSKSKLVSVKDIYYNKAKTHVFWADDHMFLLAGKDCSDGEVEGTCVYPVVVAHSPIPEYISYMTGMKASEHIFCSAIKEPDSPCEGVASE